MIAFKMYSQTKNHTIFTDCVITEIKIFYGHTNMKNNTHKSIEPSKKKTLLLSQAIESKLNYRLFSSLKNTINI